MHHRHSSQSIGALLLCLAAAAFFVPAGCDDDETACVPGTTIECVGPGSCDGAQECNAEGSGYEACDCGVTGGGDEGAGSAVGGSGGEGAGAAVGGGGEGGGGVTLEYPPGPYGTAVGDTVANLSWTAFVDTDDMYLYGWDDEPRSFSLAEHYVQNDSEAEILFIVPVFKWCGECYDNWYDFDSLISDYRPYGVRFIFAVVEDDDAAPATEAAAQSWGNQFGMLGVIAVDSAFKLEPYLPSPLAPPYALLVDAKDMTILDVLEGDAGPDVEFYYDALNFYLGT